MPKRQSNIKGQSRTEYFKNFKRVDDIVAKTSDEDEQNKLASKQAKLIKDEYKAINRAMVAKDKGCMNIFEVFFKRAYELGSVQKQEYRAYQLSKLLDFE